MTDHQKHLWIDQWRKKEEMYSIHWLCIYYIYGWYVYRPIACDPSIHNQWRTRKRSSIVHNMWMIVNLFVYCIWFMYTQSMEKKGKRWDSSIDLFVYIWRICLSQ
jgi:hypothetical protein